MEPTEDNWNEQKSLLKQKLTAINEKYFLLIDGKNDEVMDKILIKLDITKEKLFKILEDE